MAKTSDWPLSPGAVRFHVPEFILQIYRESEICRGLYPLSFGYYPNAAGHRMSRDEHDDNLLIYCVQGQTELMLEGRDHRVRPGDLVVLPKDTVHAYRTLDDDPWTIFWVHFEGELSQAYLDNLGYSFETPLIPLGVLPKLVSDFEAMLAVRKTGYSVKAFIHLANHLTQLLTFIAIQIPKIQEGSGYYLDLDAIHAYMQRNIHGQLDLDALAAQVKLSKYYFARRYKQLTGETPIGHFIRMKMEHACYLLDLSGRSINAIAQELGYEDPYYFSRLFSKVIGLPPREYRRLKYR